jgi:hypothetical protein
MRGMLAVAVAVSVAMFFSSPREFNFCCEAGPQQLSNPGDLS